MTTRLSAVLPWIAWLVPAGVAVQAVLTGQTWFTGAALTGLHGGIGHGVLTASVLTAALTWLLPGRRGVPGVLATIAVVALIAQVGLGYTGHRSGVTMASALHVPLGVGIAILTAGVATYLSVGRGSREGVDPA